MTKGKKWKAKVRAKAESNGISYAATRQTLSTRTSTNQRRIDVDPDETRAQFRDKSLASWRSVVRHFGGGKVWTDVADIVEVLDYVARTAMTNHTHFPDGGGLDLESASLSGETGCLALQFDSRVAAVVGKPEMLELVVPDRDPLGEWAYFRLELSELKPTGLEDNIEYGYEQLTEVYPGQYDRFERLDSEVPLPGSARAVSRYLQGAFLTIPKASRYNANPQTYDGRHSRMSADQFKQYVVAEIEQLWRSDNYGVDRRTGRKTSLS